MLIKKAFWLTIHAQEMENQLVVSEKLSQKIVQMQSSKLNLFKHQISELNIGLSDQEKIINTQQSPVQIIIIFGCYTDNQKCHKIFINQQQLILKKIIIQYKNQSEQNNDIQNNKQKIGISINDYKSLLFLQMIFIYNCIIKPNLKKTLSLKSYYSHFHLNNMTHYRQDWSYTKIHQDYPDKGQFDNPIQNVQQQLLKYVKSHAQKGNLQSCINIVDQFCAKHWMMNLGPEKGQILKNVFQKYQPKNILELGGYCGYSSLVFSHLSTGNIHTIQISQKYAKIARQMHQFAGVAQRNHVSVGTVQTLKEEIQKRGPYDAILIDHAKQLYLDDFHLLEGYGVIKKGTLVLGDNIIYPGPKGYLDHFKGRKDYDSTLYHSFVQYSNIPDAILVSQKLQ